MRRRNLGDHLPHAVHGCRIADQPRRTFVLFEAPLHGSVLVGQLALLCHAAEQRFQLGKLARLGQVIERTVPQGRDRGLDARFAGEHDGLGVGRKLFGPLDDLDAVQARACRDRRADSRRCCAPARRRRSRRRDRWWLRAPSAPARCASAPAASARRRRTAASVLYAAW